MKNYKATTNFSFGGVNYVEGQAVNITDEDTIEKLKERKQISSGEGTPAEDIAADSQKEMAKKSAEADKKRDEEAEAREKEFLDRQSKPKGAKFRVDDQTQGIKEKNDKSGPNDPKK